tara:strand:- start:994 stop:3285 length:2292 start_codon:yes stop_codon:yes gene_type:complete
MKESNFFRWSLLALSLMAISAPFLIHGMFQGAAEMRNSPIRWIPKSFEQRATYDWFTDRFQLPEYVIISWPGCTIDDQRLQTFADAVEQDPNGPGSSEPWFDSVMTGYETIQSLQDAPLYLPRNRAVKRMRGILVGPDGEISCAVVGLTELGTRKNQRTFKRLLDITSRALNIHSDSVYLAGSPIDGVAIDVASANSVRTFMLPSTLLVLLLCRWCLRSWPLTFAVLVTALFGQALVLSAVYFAKIYFANMTMNAVLTVMAPLVFVLTVSAGIHLVNYYHDEVQLKGISGAAQRALINGWAPCVLAALTTAIGLLSLTVSQIIPVKHFGIFASLGLVSTTTLLFVVLPGTMVRWPVTVLTDNHANGGRSNAFFDGFASFIARFWPWITLLCVGWMAASVFGLWHIKTSVKVLSMLGPESRTVRDYHWMEDHVGPMVPLEIVLKFPQNSQLDLLEKMTLIRGAQMSLEKIKNIDGTMSAASFFPPIPSKGGLRTARRAVLLKQLKKEQQQLIDRHFLHGLDSEEQSWRISARAPAVGDLDYGKFLDELKSRVEPALEAYNKKTGYNIGVIYTGVMPLVYNVQRAMLSDLIYSYLTALCLVGILMIVVLKSPLAGFLTMLPNMFPTFILFGAMGWLERPVDIGSMMSASVALGIAVDGTLHFLNWFRKETQAGCSRVEAVSRTFRHCARSITQTTFVCGLGLLVYAFSEFVPTRRFAFMMFALLMAAWIGDLLLLPALLISPLGKWFVGRKRNHSSELESPDATT